MRRTPETPAGVGGKSLRRKTPITLSLLALGAPRPTERDFSKLADKLEKDPPAELTRESLSLITQILRGEEPHS